MARDLATSLWREGYLAIPRARRHGGGADAFETTLLGRRAVVVRGPAGTRLFYDPALVEREGVVPRPLADLLFGKGAVHGLDGAAHAERKSMFLDLLTTDRVEDLATAIGRDLERRVLRWRDHEVAVFDELVEVYGAAVQAWAGVADGPSRIRRRSRLLAEVVDGFGGAPAAYPRAWAARIRLDRWARGLVAAARSGDAAARPGSVLADFASGRAAHLGVPVAGVELLNILRPTVAVAWPGTFLARQLTEHPLCREGLASGDGRGRESFGHEVRRTCPFVPALAGRARTSTHLGEIGIVAGDLVVLDVPGTDLDASSWARAEVFDPERFRDHDPDPLAFVPQGGADARTGHRCPGEPLTVRILSETARVLGGLRLEPLGDTAHDPTRIPALPSRGLRVRVR